MNRRRLLLALGLLGLSCTPQPRSDYHYTIPHPGPALMGKVRGGYELKNRWVRLVIDDQTGDVSYWGAADGDQNLLGNEGVRACLSAAPDTAPTGHVEKRDDQTWQYVGEDADRIRWRKIYSLDGESIYATFLVENMAEEPRNATVVVRFDLRAEQVAGDDLLLAGPTDVAPVVIQGYRESHGDPNYQVDRPTLRSDTQTLKPDERVSFTTEWKIDHPRME